MEQIDVQDVPQSAYASKSVQEVVTRKCASGGAILYHLDDGSYAVKWSDEPDLVPLTSLGYNSELGVFDKRHFPNEKSE